MGLEKSIFGMGKKFAKALAITTLSSILSSCPVEEPSKPKPHYEYKTSVEIVKTQEIDSETGGEIKIDDENNFLYGTELEIPPGSLNNDTTISVGVVNNPPPLPSGLNYVGTTIDLQPDGTIFGNPATLRIQYTDESLSDAGLSDDSNLQLYSYNPGSKKWEEVDPEFYRVDSGNNQIFAGLAHCSYYAITMLSNMPPEDLGNPQPGDLLYSLGAVWDEGNPQLKDNWMPGHVGIYTGEKIYSSGLASDDVKKFGKYNVIEALPRGVQFSYYGPISNFSGLNSYAGAREPKDFILTQQQREDIVEFAEAQIGKDYAIGPMIDSIMGMDAGWVVKGPDEFNCVGLAEAAYESANTNNKEGLISYLHEIYLVTPAEQYRETKPATGLNLQKIINAPDIYEGVRHLASRPAEPCSQTFRLNHSYLTTIEVNISTISSEGDQLILSLFIDGTMVRRAISNPLQAGYDGWVKFNLPLEIYSDSVCEIVLEGNNSTFGWKYSSDTYSEGIAFFNYSEWSDHDFLFRVNY